VRAATAQPAPLAGIALVITAMALFATLDTTAKLVSMSVPLLMAIWFRYCFQAIVTTLAVLPQRGLAVLKTQHPKFQLLRGLLLLTSSFFAFGSLQYLPVADFTAICSLVPLIITLLAGRMLGERVSRLRWVLVLGAFAGALVIIRPGGENFIWPMLLPLGAVVSYSWFQLLTSRMVKTESPVTMHLYTGWVGTLVTSFMLPFVWVQPTAIQLGQLLLMGMLGTVGHFFLILAYARSPASTLTPYLYAQIGFAMVGGWLVFGQVPDDWALVGIGMIAVCGVAGALLTGHESRALRELPVQPLET
jgi:drug/metabolite transporter (DMT)-like permease